MPVLVPADPRWEQLDEMQAALDARPVIGPTPRELVDTSTWGPQFPTWVYGSGGSVADTDTVNRESTPPQDQQLTLAAENGPIRFGYGRDRIGADVLNILLYNRYVYVQCLWGYSCLEIESVTFNDEALDPSISVTHYTGSQSAVDPWMETAFFNQSPSVDYNDTLAGFSYSVFKIPQDLFNGGAEFAAIIKWRNVYDPRNDDTNGGSGDERFADSSTWTGRDNPTLCLVDFLTNSVYGASLSVDWDSVITCANWNDTLIGGERSRILDGWTHTGVSKVDSVIETLRTYASVFTVNRGLTVRLVADKNEASVATYSHTAGNIASVSAVEKEDMTGAPTMVSVAYTDTSKMPWAEAYADSPPISGETVRRLSTIRLNGIQRHEQAYREAVERLNKLTQNDLSFKLIVFDAGIKHEFGDIITVTLPFGGVTAKLMRVLDCQSKPPGMWELSLQEFDASVYSTAVVEGPSTPDTTLPSPLYPPPPTGLSATEEMFQQADGSWNSRLRITFTAPTGFDWVDSYRVEVYDNIGKLVDAATVLSTTYGTPPLVEGVDHTIKVATISTVGAKSDYAQTNKTFLGKLAPPTDVTTITGFEIAGSVFLSWTASNDLDLRDYEIRYAATDVGWASATMIDRVNALRTEIKGVLPEGSWWFYVKARDTVGNYSANAAKCNLTVTLDPNALQTEAYDITPMTLTGMVNWTERDGSVYDQTSVGSTSWATMFSSAMSTYANPIASYWAGSFVWEAYAGSDPWGVQLSGDWNVDWMHTDISGTATKTLRLSENDADWADWTTLPVKDTARYARSKLSGTGAIRIKRGVTRVYVNATTREEVGNDTSTSGAKTVPLDGNYFTWRDFAIQPYATGTGSEDTYTTFIDNIVMHPTNTNSFDVHILDPATGLHVTGINFNWKFKGI